MSLTENELNNNKKYIGVETISNLRYSALSMGAGEQRAFEIITKVVSAPKYSIILIDELDLLLHTEALKKLNPHLHSGATNPYFTL